MKLKQLKTKAVYTYYYKTSKFKGSELANNLVKLQKKFAKIIKHSDVFVAVINPKTKEVLVDRDLDNVFGMFRITEVPSHTQLFMKIEVVTAKRLEKEVKL